MARLALSIVGFQCVALTSARASDVASSSWRALSVPVGDAVCIQGARPEHVALFACEERCSPIPWQLDERDEDGELVLDQGPQASVDVDGGLIDSNDELVFMWADMTTSPVGGSVEGARCIDEIEVAIRGERRWLRAALYAGPAPRSPIRYVDYDQAGDRMSSDRVALTFGGPTPRGLALRSGTLAGRDLLDRLKIRASARFFGVFPLHRDEDSIQSVYEAWRVGPIRVIRRERKWVDLAFGFRTPYMRTETTFYRDYALLPVRMRLNFAPATLLSAIHLRAALDFIDLRGWRLWFPGSDDFWKVPLEVGKASPDDLQRLADVAVPLLAIKGDDAILALMLRLSPSLSSLRRTILYEEGPRAEGPEGHAGSLPSLGFHLTDWGGVDRGDHWFVAESYALAPEQDLAVFAAEIEAMPAISVRKQRLANQADPHLTTASPIH